MSETSRERYQRGMTTGRLECIKCRKEKLVEDFPRDKQCGWNYWCRACHCAYRKDKAAAGDEKVVWVRLDPATHEYMMSEMLPNTMAKSAGQLARKILVESVMAHKRACAAIKTVPAPAATHQAGWPTRAQLMGGR